MAQFPILGEGALEILALILNEGVGGLTKIQIKGET